jgi:pyridinium-3,5-biscarboxylic acid mononucleotide sulfurtransferase
MNDSNTETAAEEKTLDQKLETCRAMLRGLERVVVAFSAGVDSTFLLALAAEVLGQENVLAVTGISPSYPKRERSAGIEIAKQIGVRLLEVETCEMNDPNYASNPANRCFYCKTELFSRFREIAESRDMGFVLSGANADDSGDYRPGLQAGDKLGVLNPLQAAGLSKNDIREASRLMGLPTWDKPQMACLASRVPYGEPITVEKLARIERAENALRDLGFSQCRVRDHETVARIELLPEQISRSIELRDTITQSLKKIGYSYITLDLEGFRSGSMNEVL